MVEGRVSVIIPGRCEPYFQQTIDSVLEQATGDVEVVAVVDGPGQEPVIKSEDPRVKIIKLEQSVGQRAAYNLGVKQSSGEFVMKIDAHALLSPGFDETLKAHCPEKTVVLPEMRRLDVDAWKDKPRGKTLFMFFGLDMYCHFWPQFAKTPEGQMEYPPVMNGNGSCWFTCREWNDWIGLLDEGVGSWGNVGIEVGLRTWLCGGSLIANRKAWQAHWFRKDEGGFTYPMSGRQVGKAHRYTKENYYYRDDAFEHQVRPFYWLIDKFKPPGWEAYLADEFKSPRVIVYYTDSVLDEKEPILAKAVRKRITKACGPIPVISVSQKPLNFGENICVGDKPKTYRSMYEQLLVGLEAAPPESICYLCEHDVFYHPSHFAKLPERDDKAYFNLYRYHYYLGAKGFIPARGKKAMSQCVARREMLIDHCRKRIALMKQGKGKRMKISFENFSSARPNVDVRHKYNLTPEGHYKFYYRKGQKQKGQVYNLPGWGSPKHFERKTGYKRPAPDEVMRWDIIQHLIDKHSYESYLEIGVDKGKTFDRIQCDLKHGVDPRGHKQTHRMTSDEFFVSSDGQMYDLIFIDGLHESEQVKKDIANALEHLTPRGTVVMHDCKPRDEREQRVPRPRKQGTWTGDVWKAFVHYRRRPDLEMYVVDTNNGIGIVRRGQQEPLVVDDPTYEEFRRNRKRWLNLSSVESFREHEGKRASRRAYARA